MYALASNREKTSDGNEKKAKQSEKKFKKVANERGAAPDWKSSR